MTPKKTLKLIADLEDAITYVGAVHKHLKSLGSPLNHQRKLEDSLVMMKHLLEKHK